MKEIKPRDYAQRRGYTEWVLEYHEINADFSKKIIFSDETHFQFNGYVNKKNC